MRNIYTAFLLLVVVGAFGFVIADAATAPEISQSETSAPYRVEVFTDGENLTIIHSHVEYTNDGIPFMQTETYHTFILDGYSQVTSDSWAW